MVDYGYITKDQVVSRYHRWLHHGYPVPFLIREELLGQIQPWLQRHHVYSRGRFGGWRYEVSNQDHSFSQGVEIAEYLMTGAPEQTYPDPNKVNSQKNTGHPKLSVPTVPEYEFVVSHMGGSLDFMAPHSNHCHIYHRGNEIVPRYEFRQWDRLPRVGGKAHAYLHHIITNYNHLADVTVFLGDDMRTCSSTNGCPYHNILDYVEETKRNGISYKRPGIALKFESITSGASSRLGSLAEFWKTVFIDRLPPKEITFTPGSYFGVSSARIHKHSLEFYKNILLQMSPRAQDGTEFNRHMDKLWITIFT